MNRIVIWAVTASAICLAACDRGADPPVAKQRAKADKPAPGANVNQPVEDAMMQIPPRMRETYQAAFRCEVERSKARGGSKTIAVTADYVRNLVRRLKDDPALARC